MEEKLHHVDLKGHVAGGDLIQFKEAVMCPLLGDAFNIIAAVKIHFSEPDYSGRFFIHPSHGGFDDSTWSRYPELAGLTESQVAFLKVSGSRIVDLLSHELKPAELKSEEDRHADAFFSMIRKFAAKKSFRGCNRTEPRTYTADFKIGTFGESHTIHFDTTSDCRAIIAIRSAFESALEEMHCSPMLITLGSLRRGEETVNWQETLRAHYYAHVFSFLSFLG